MVIVKLKPWAQRAGKGESQDAVLGKLYAQTAGIKDARIIFFGRPTLQGFGNAAGFEMQLQDQKGGTIDDLNKVTNDFIDALKKRPEIQNAYTSFNPNFPQYLIDVDVASIKNAGYSVSDVLSVIQGYFGGVYASNINLFGKQYRVIYQAPPNQRANVESFDVIKVRSSTGAMAPVSRFVTLKRVYGPQSISRFNLFTAVTVNGTPNPGYSSGDAIRPFRKLPHR
jgi:HAE1 family hydrophobic/amphiphilic exporter-1